MLFNLNVAKYLLIIIVPLVIILGNFRYLVLDVNFYDSLYQESGVYQTFSKSQAIAITRNLLGYFKGQTKIDQGFFSGQAILHLKDVKGLIIFATSLLYLSLSFVGVVTLTLIAKRKYQALISAFFTSSLITIVFVLFLSLGIFKAFEPLFTKFHHVLFTNNLWLFPASDNLVKLFPQEFFITFANQLALNIGLTCLILAATSFVLKKGFTK